MLVVIAPDKQRLRLPGLAVFFRTMMAFPPAAHRRLPRQVFQLKEQDILHHRAFDFHRIILLRLRAVVGHVLVGVVDPAHERDIAIHHHNFAVHPAKDVGTHAEERRARIVIAEHHACGGQLVDEAVAEVGRTVSVEQHFDFDTALSRAQHGLMELTAHVVLEPDKSFENNFLLCRIEGSKNGGIILIAIFQQRNLVTFSP
ncbi:hypothetical protein D3C72_1304230 [compost metagenome]